MLGQLVTRHAKKHRLSTTKGARDEVMLLHAGHDALFRAADAARGVLRGCDGSNHCLRRVTAALSAVRIEVSRRSPAGILALMPLTSGMLAAPSNAAIHSAASSLVGAAASLGVTISPVDSSTTTALASGMVSTSVSSSHPRPQMESVTRRFALVSA